MRAIALPLAAAAALLLLAPAPLRAEDEPAVIKEGSKVSLEYTLKLDDGSTADTNVGQDPLEYEQGKQEILPNLEKQLVGLKVNDTKQVTLAPEDAYGVVDPALRREVPAAQILAGNESEGFGRLMQFQADRAKEYYAKALAALPQPDRRAQRPGLIMAAIYRALLDEIERDGFHVLKAKTSLTPLRKLWIAWKTWVAA